MLAVRIDAGGSTSLASHDVAPQFVPDTAAACVATQIVVLIDRSERGVRQRAAAHLNLARILSSTLSKNAGYHRLG